jgi:hypothetical protein
MTDLRAAIEALPWTDTNIRWGDDIELDDLLALIPEGAVVVTSLDWRICRLHGKAQDDPTHEYRYPDCENAGYVDSAFPEGAIVVTEEEPVIKAAFAVVEDMRLGLNKSHPQAAQHLAAYDAAIEERRAALGPKP